MSFLSSRGMFLEKLYPEFVPSYSLTKAATSPCVEVRIPTLEAPYPHVLGPYLAPTACSHTASPRLQSLGPYLSVPSYSLTKAATCSEVPPVLKCVLPYWKAVESRFSAIRSRNKFNNESDCSSITCKQP